MGERIRREYLLRNPNEGENRDPFGLKLKAIDQLYNYLERQLDNPEIDSEQQMVIMRNLSRLGSLYDILTGYTFTMLRLNRNILEEARQRLQDEQGEGKI
jgi:hypothetical protein